jgi:hypothetical protein
MRRYDEALAHLNTFMRMWSDMFGPNARDKDKYRCGRRFYEYIVRFHKDLEEGKEVVLSDYPAS